MQNLRIVYLGTPDFAVEPLRRLLERQRACESCGYEIVGVVTMPDKMINKRGNQLLMSPVKQYAVEQGLPVLQPESLKDEAFQSALRAWGADLQIVVAFRMLPESVWNMPRLGTFNLHASLLPQYRGAAPINWAIINGDKETGVTTFFLKHEIDTGDVIYRDVVAIDESDNAGTLHDKLMMQGGDTVLRTVEAIVKGDVTPIAQDKMTVGELRPAPKIFRDTCRINWQGSVDSVYNFVRGMSPYPAAWCELVNAGDEAVALKVYAVSKEYAQHDKAAGAIVTDGKNYIKVAVEGGYVSLDEVQLAGKKRMPVADLLRGFSVEGMKAAK